MADEQLKAGARVRQTEERIKRFVIQAIGELQQEIGMMPTGLDVDLDLLSVPRWEQGQHDTFLGEVKVKLRF